MILQVLSPQIQIEMPHIWLYEVWWWAIKPYLSCFCDLPDASVFFAFPTRNQIWVELSPGKLFKNFKGKLHFETSLWCFSVLTCQGSQTSVCDLPQRKGLKTGSTGRRGGPGNLSWEAWERADEIWQGLTHFWGSCCYQVWKLVDKFLFCWKGFYLVQISRWFLPFLCFASFWWKLKYHRNLILYFSRFTCAKTRSILWYPHTQQEMCLAWGVSGLHGSWKGSVGIFDMISTYFGGQNLAPLRRMLKTLWYFLCQLVHDFAHQQ